MRYLYLYLIIFLEGYVVLATELIAMRQLIPFVGSGTETVAIVIAAVLMPLAFGYYYGGKYKTKRGRYRIVNIRQKLIRNILYASVFLVLGLSYIFLEYFFQTLSKIGITHRIFQVSIYSIIFLVIPVYLLGQTVPLISNFFKRQNLSEFTGKILFFSTVGSFAGAIISTIIFMSLIGVNNTVIVSVLLLAIVVFILSRKLLSTSNVIMAALLAVLIFLNNTFMMQKLNIVENNRYSTIKIKQNADNTIEMNINNSNSAKYAADSKRRYAYVKFIENQLINPLVKAGTKKKILVLGAGGFTIGVDDTLNDYTFVDIDSSLKKVSQDHLLPPWKLGDNKKFLPQDARAFLYENKEQYDLIILDVYTNIFSVPAYLLNAEFFSKVKETLADNGILAFNFIGSPNFATRYSVKVDNTLKEVFPNISRQILWITPISLWDPKPPLPDNIIYLYFKKDFSSGIYTDDKNTYFLDH